uniref:FAS1 domain-containing protein n=1 Tax=Timema poppense TaxID=170557 RepID=A0A7R9DQZ8_TIMPO|nr:unnamed protein product [Timema poppensis]
MLRVTISFTTQSDGRTSRPYVKSNTHLGDGNHAEGVVLAEIVKANIPVKNGVVHLIHRPLMVVDTTVQQFLEAASAKWIPTLLLFYALDKYLNEDRQGHTHIW